MELGLSLSLTGIRNGFSLSNYMASQSDGFWFDLTRSDTMFQEDVGPTPADGAGEVIGLALSQRLWGGQTLAGYLAGQPELVTPGAWTLTAAPGASATESPAGTLNLVGNGDADSALAQQSISTVSGRIYKFSADVVVGAGTITFRLGTISGASDVYTAPFSTDFELYFVAKSSTTHITISKSGSTATVSEISSREVSRYAGIQSTSSYKPKFQAGGAAFDGTDDNLLTGYIPSAAANFLVAKITVPASVPVFQYVLGTATGPTSERLGIGINTDGVLGIGVGSNSPASTGKTSSGDIRGQTVVVGLSHDGSTVRGFCGSSMVLEIVASGVPTTTYPIRLGSNNSAGTPGNYFSGSIAKVVAGREFIDLARFLQIANALQ